MAAASARVAGGAGLQVAPPAFAGRLCGASAPFVLVAWLTAQLGTAILGARKRAAHAGESDPLTGLANRRVFEIALRREHEQAANRRVPYGVLVLDVDGLGNLNARSGPAAGDAALRLVAKVLKRGLRDTDVAARWGGDEFAVLLPGADLGAAVTTGRRLRSAVHAAPLSVGVRTIRCSVHVGAASGPQDGHEPRDLVSVAELRMRKDRESRGGGPPAQANG
ncbi:MAG: GGDEF domain-containing protein [Pseudomonadota bacterium]